METPILEGIKCEFCGGNGEVERYVEPYGDSPMKCSFCYGTGIDINELGELQANVVLDGVFNVNTPENRNLIKTQIEEYFKRLWEKNETNNFA